MFGVLLPQPRESFVPEQAREERSRGQGVFRLYQILSALLREAPRPAETARPFHLSNPRPV
jgi:hypothetical protein